MSALRGVGSLIVLLAVTAGYGLGAAPGAAAAAPAAITSGTPSGPGTFQYAPLSSTGQTALRAAAAEPTARSITDAAVAAATPYTPRTPPVTPDARADECLAQPGAADAGGLVLNRFVWCQKWTLSAVVPNTTSSLEMRYSAVAYGRDDGRRGITVFFRGDSYTLNPVGLRGYIRASSPLYQRVCVGTCADESYVVKPVSGWIGSWSRFEFTSEDGGTGPDRITRPQWRLDGYVVDITGAPTAPGQGAVHTARCDSAQYFNKTASGAACVHGDVTPNLRYSTADPTQRGVARHVQCAFRSDCTTYPDPARGGKVFPGDYQLAGSAPGTGLHRITASRGSPPYDANRAASRAACRALPASVYDTARGEDCDEYPFASVREGAACCATGINWDLSVRGVPSAENQCAGRSLQRFYRLDRILKDTDEDSFYVAVTDSPPAAAPECVLDVDVVADPPDDPDADWQFDGDNSPPPVNAAPTVSGGPDVSGSEGQAIRLAGSAADDRGAPSVRWTYQAVTAAAGARCAFADTSSATTTFTCTDNGSYRATISASDGALTATDTVTVTVRNVAPELPAIGLSAPSAWQVFTVGRPVTFDAEISDPGTSDTHTCDFTWDDGSTTSAAAQAGSCIGSHTFTAAGIYTLRTTVTDDDGGRSAPLPVIVVVYDRRGGPAASVKGLFSSPAGSQSAAPTASGPGSVVAQAAYLPTGSGPAPEVGLLDVKVPFTFSLVAKPPLLRDTTLDWLVVTPAHRMALKGTALGQDGKRYGFVAQGWEGNLFKGQPTRFRLIAWLLADGANPTAASAKIVYDNARGTGFDLDEPPPPALPLGFAFTLTLPN